jgi:hypothetical protein
MQSKIATSIARFRQIAQAQAGRIADWRALELLKTDQTGQNLGDAGIDCRF